MCGITGIVAWDDRIVCDEATVERMRDTLRHRGPDDSGAHVRAGRRVALGAPPAVDRGSLRCRAPADVQRGRHRLDHLQRRGLQPRGAAWRAGGQGPRLPLAHRQRDDPAPLRGGGAAVRRAPRGDVRASPSGTDAVASCSWPATASASSRCTTRMLPGGFVFASELKALLAHPAVRARARRGGVLRLPHVRRSRRRHGRCSQASASSRRRTYDGRRADGPMSRASYWDAAIALGGRGGRSISDDRRRSSGCATCCASRSASA